MKLVHKIEEMKQKLKFEMQSKKDANKKIEKFENHILEKECQAPTDPIRQTINNLVPYTLTAEKATQITDRYTFEDYKRGPDGTIDFIETNHLGDEQGNPMLVCTDTSRCVFRGVEEDRTEFMDVGGRRFIKVIRKPKLNGNIGISRGIPNKKFSFYDLKDLKAQRRALSPKKLAKSLAPRFVKTST